MQLAKQMDWVGFGLFSLGCILFLIGINWGGRQYDWSSAHVIATIVVGAVVLIVLGFYEVYVPLQYPMLPAKLFRNIRGFTVLLILCFVAGMLYYSMNVLWPRVRISMGRPFPAFKTLADLLPLYDRNLAYCSCHKISQLSLVCTRTWFRSEPF